VGNHELYNFTRDQLARGVEAQGLRFSCAGPVHAAGGGPCLVGRVEAENLAEGALHHSFLLRPGAQAAPASPRMGAGPRVGALAGCGPVAPSCPSKALRRGARCRAGGSRWRVVALDPYSVELGGRGKAMGGALGATQATGPRSRARAPTLPASWFALRGRTDQHKHDRLLLFLGAS
jgi:hypothetical protein